MFRLLYDFLCRFEDSFIEKGVERFDGFDILDDRHLEPLIKRLPNTCAIYRKQSK